MTLWLHGGRVAALVAQVGLSFDLSPILWYALGVFGLPILAAAALLYLPLDGWRTYVRRVRLRSRPILSDADWRATLRASDEGRDFDRVAAAMEVLASIARLRPTQLLPTDRFAIELAGHRRLSLDLRVCDELPRRLEREFGVDPRGLREVWTIQDLLDLLCRERSDSASV